LRTKKYNGNNNNSNNNNNNNAVEPIPTTETSMCGVFEKSHVVTIEKEYVIIIPAKVTMHQGQLGLRMKSSLGCFLPLTEFQNQVWLDYKSDGIYINKRDPFCPEWALDYWKGAISSNSIIVNVKQVDPILLPIRINEYQKKCNILLSRRLSSI